MMSKRAVKGMMIAVVALAVAVGCRSVFEHIVDETLPAGGGFAQVDSDFTDAPTSPGGTGTVVEEDDPPLGEVTRSFFTAFQIDPEAEDTSGPKFIEAADIDKDGLLDLVTGWNQSQPIQLHLQRRDAEGNLSFRTITLAGTDPIATLGGIKTGQINDDNGDGLIDDNDWIDLVVLSKTTGHVTLCPKNPPIVISVLEGEIIILFNPGIQSLIADGAQWKLMRLVNPLIADHWIHNQFPGHESMSFEDIKTKPEWGGFTDLVVANIDGREGDDIIVALNPGECEELGQLPPTNTVDLWANPGAGFAEDSALWGVTLAREPGELRGQIGTFGPPDDVGVQLLSANMIGASEVPPNNSLATGTGSFVLNAAQTELDYDFLIGGVTCVVQAIHVHVGASGETGPVVMEVPRFQIELKRDGWVAKGSWAVSPAVVASLLAGGLYVNVHTQPVVSRGVPLSILADAPQVKDIEALDIDQDGDLDIIATFTNSITKSIRWARNPLFINDDPGAATGWDELTRGTGCDGWRYLSLGWEERPIGQVDTAADVIALGDIDNDGFQDVVVRSTIGQLVQWFRQPNPLSVAPEFPPNDTVPDRDDTPIFPEEFNFPWPVFTLTEFESQEPEGISVGDVTGDGRPEIIIAAEGAVFWYDGTVGDSVFDPWSPNTIIQDSEEETTAPGSGPAPIPAGAPPGAGVGVTSVDASTHINRLLVVDLDGDGRLDIIATLDRRTGPGLSDDRIVWYRNTKTDDDEPEAP